VLLVFASTLLGGGALLSRRRSARTFGT